MQREHATRPREELAQTGSRSLELHRIQRVSRRRHVGDQQVDTRQVGESCHDIRRDLDLEAQLLGDAGECRRGLGEGMPRVGVGRGAAREHERPWCASETAHLIAPADRPRSNSLCSAR